MKENIAGTLAIDAGVIIELLFQSKAGITIRNALLEEIIDAHTYAESSDGRKAVKESRNS